MSFVSNSVQLPFATFLLPVKCSGWCASSAVGVSTTITKQQFVVTHRHTALMGTEGTWPILNRPTLKLVMFLWKYQKPMFCGHNVWTDGVFVTQLSSDAGISVWRTVGYDKSPFRERYVKSSNTSACFISPILIKTGIFNEIYWTFPTLNFMKINSVMLQLSRPAVVTFCSCHVLQLSRSAVVTFCSCHVLQLSRYAVVTFCSCHVLQLSRSAVVTFCSCHVLQLSRSTVVTFWHADSHTEMS